jgi:glutamate-5-semialdehyde dehydrogenase
LTADRIRGMADGVREVAALADPIGEIVDGYCRPNGLRIQKTRVPLGVAGIIYEARPNVTSDAAALCLKSGNAVILKGGKEAFRSNMAIASILRNSLQESGLPTDALIFIETTDREAVNHLIHLRGDIDLLIPRGGEGLIRFVSENATVPVIQHYKGVCHIFVEKTADMAKTLPILLNAKCQRPGVCNAMETLLLDDGLSAADEANIIRTLIQNGVTLHVDDALFALYHGENVVEATEEDWPKEYLSLDLAVRRVHGLDEAIDHIARYSSNHTESILTEDASLAERFLHEVNSSTVLVNASTRFADGGELGLGAEIGISTSKLHAYGPMGCGELTTRKFVVRGEGQIRK